MERHQERNKFRGDFVDSAAQTVRKNNISVDEFTCP